jgi:HlyD family secretion protein
MRRTLLIVGLLAAVAIAVGLVGPRLWSRKPPDPQTAALGEEAPQSDQTRITGRGSVVPVRWTALSFPISGQLGKLHVTEGMTVTEGETLASLESSDFALQVRLAESDLQARQAELAELQQGVSQAELDAAQASLDAESAAYQELLAGPSDSERALAAADLDAAQRALHRAQSAYDAVSGRPDISARPEALQLEQATLDYERAQVVYQAAIAGPSPATLKQAESRVASAKAHLQDLTRAQPNAILLAESAVNRSQVALEQTKLRLEQAVISAPYAGTITSIAATQLGDTINPGSPLITIADLTELQVELTDLDEWGAANVTQNQTVDLVVPALGNRNLRGHVRYVSSEPTVTSSGAVFYQAFVSLDEQPADLRWGNTVRIRLYVAGAHGVGFR